MSARVAKITVTYEDGQAVTYTGHGHAHICNAAAYGQDPLELLQLSLIVKETDQT